ncbi:hypothetical protein EDB84DRAFT_1436749 [Lactarius hengduanensis]|nr:hypothetical protein EDB84DRAFT_1436749 [Lactarius hengduanensis]
MVLCLNLSTVIAIPYTHSTICQIWATITLTEIESGQKYQLQEDLEGLTVTRDVLEGFASHAQDAWYPWPDMIVGYYVAHKFHAFAHLSLQSCTLDIVMHLPRSPFSIRQLDVMNWLLSANGISGTRSTSSMHRLNKTLHDMCGIRTLPYDGALGNRFYVNSLEDIIAQVSRWQILACGLHLRFYPEDTGGQVSEYWHAHHWGQDANPMHVTPMATSAIVMPSRWFIRNRVIHAVAWTLRPYHDVSSDHIAGWIVEEYNNVVVSQSEFLIPFASWGASDMTTSLPDPKRILGSLLDPTGGIQEWTRTDPATGNYWHGMAHGARVVCFPIWLYCDDVSGNLSKKWNKHNSFLFSAAGLPRALIQQEYNIHFLCTSNLAPPLEMLDGIVMQLEEAWKTGVWAWDCALEERTLVIPFIAGLLGDNPMQSGKYLCRICNVKGAEKGVGHPQGAENPSSQGERDGPAPDESLTAAGSDGDSVSAGPSAPRVRKKKEETMQEMVDRTARFVQAGELRTKAETLKKIEEIVQSARYIGNQTTIKELKTNSGIKDSFLESFLDRLHLSYKGLSGNLAKQSALNNCLATLPQNITNPVWRIEGLDPHSDTPVEVLHTVLLGFVKYFWCDAIQFQIGRSAAQRDLLKTQLNSFNVSGLQIPPLAGHLLVAPFVLYDLVLPACFDAWVSLSNLIPLIWQLVIQDIDDYIDCLEIAIKDFLMRTAKWSPRWFNKPKFHILLHLPTHVRRFGPAILFATEPFESFNAIIRAKSIHSNCLAPSHDIALAFAHANRVRHLLSGGRHHVCPGEEFGRYSCSFDSLSTPAHVAMSGVSLDAGEAGVWRRGAPAPLRLIEEHAVIRSYLGLDGQSNSNRFGTCTHDKSEARSYRQTNAYRYFPAVLERLSVATNSHVQEWLTATNTSMVLMNGDACQVNSWVLIDPPHAEGQRRTVAQASQPDAILLQRANISWDASAQLYRMPAVILTDDWELLRITDILSAVNVQHRCYNHGCKASGVEYIYQERQVTTQIRRVVEHINPSDCVLNTARMQDAAQLDAFRFRIDPTSILFTDAILEGVRKEFDSHSGRSGARALAGGLPSMVGPDRLGRRRGRGASTGIPSSSTQRSTSQGGEYYITVASLLVSCNLACNPDIQQCHARCFNQLTIATSPVSAQPSHYSAPSGSEPPENKPTSSLTTKQEFCLLLLQSILMDPQFAFPQVQIPNVSRVSCAPPVQGVSTPSGPTGSNPTTPYTTPPQAPSNQRAFYPPGHHAQTPWSPCRNLPPRIPSPSFDLSQTLPVYDPALSESPRQRGLTASFVDRVANDFGFSERDQEFCTGLHSFARTSPLRMYTLGILYEVLRELRTRAESMQRFELTLIDVSARLEGTFSLTHEQKSNIRLIAGELIFEPRRVSYMQIHLAVEPRVDELEADFDSS